MGKWAAVTHSGAGLGAGEVVVALDAKIRARASPGSSGGQVSQAVRQETGAHEQG